MKRLLPIMTLLLGVCWVTQTSATMVMSGKQKYVVCGGCHGMNGEGNAALEYPPLAGLDATRVGQLLRDYQAGRIDTPKAATMRAITAPLSEDDMDNLGAYIATLGR